MINFSLFELLQRGGVTVVLLGLFSIISVALIIERARAYYRFNKETREFSVILSKALRESGLDAAAAVCAASRSSLAAVFLAGYERRAMGRAEVMRSMELAGRGELARLDSFVGVIGTIGSTAPFIGLFGTVLGIIRAFSDLAASQGASPAAVADGIAEALVATAAGLFVAVPAVMAYNFFVRKAGRNALMLERLSMEFVDALSVEQGKDVKDKESSR